MRRRESRTPSLSVARVVLSLCGGRGRNGSGAVPGACEASEREGRALSFGARDDRVDARARNGDGGRSAKAASSAGAIQPCLLSQARSGHRVIPLLLLLTGSTSQRQPLNDDARRKSERHPKLSPLPSPSLSHAPRARCGTSPSTWRGRPRAACCSRCSRPQVRTATSDRQLDHFPSPPKPPLLTRPPHQPNPTKNNNSPRLRRPRGRRRSSSRRHLLRRRRRGLLVFFDRRHRRVLAGAPLGDQEAGRLDAQQGRLALETPGHQAFRGGLGVSRAGDRAAARGALPRGRKCRGGESSGVNQLPSRARAPRRRTNQNRNPNKNHNK
jgi:hypothetical protein